LITEVPTLCDWIAPTVGWVVMPQAIRPCCSAATKVGPAPTATRLTSLLLRW
jgi:hypothetical protein